MFDFPSLGKGGPNLVSRHSTWSPVTWLVVAEAEHVKTTATGNHLSQAGDVALALLVIEDVKEPAIEHGVELLAQINQAKGICDKKTRFHTPFGRLRLRQLDRPHRGVDSNRLVSQRGRHQGVLAGTAPDIEHPTDQLPRRGEVVESWLGSPNVPRGGTG